MEASLASYGVSKIVNADVFSRTCRVRIGFTRRAAEHVRPVKGTVTRTVNLVRGVVRPRFLRGCKFSVTTKLPVRPNSVSSIEHAIFPEIVSFDFRELFETPCLTLRVT